MLKQPKKFIPSKSRIVAGNLSPILQNVRIEVGQPDDAEPLYLQGPELLIQALRAYAYKSKIVAKYLDAFSILTNPLAADLFPELKDEFGNWRMPTEDEICQYAGVDPSEFLGACYAALHHYGLQQAELLVKVAAPEVVKAAIISAKIGGKEGAADRRMLLEAAEIIKPAGPLVNVDQRSVTVNNSFPGQAEGLPAWPGLQRHEGTQAALPSARLDNVVEGELVPENSIEYVPSQSNRS